MRAEIGEPLQRERRAEREELPPVAGCGYSDPSFDPMAEWMAREAAKPKAQAVYGSIMPGVEAMPNWREFVGWIEPKENEDQTTTKPKEKAPVSKSEAAEQMPSVKAVEEQTDQVPVSAIPSLEKEAATVVDVDLVTAKMSDGASLDLGDLALFPAARSGESTTSSHADAGAIEAISVDESSPDLDVLDLGDLGMESEVAAISETDSGAVEESRVDESSLHLGDLDMASVIAAAVSSVDRVALEVDAEPAVLASDQSVSQATMVVNIDESMASLELETSVETKVDLVDNERAVTPSASPLRPVPEGAGLSSKLASVRPLAHPGRLPRKFALTEAEKEVLRLCNGQRTSQAILDSGIDLDGSQLTAFMKRCAQVKLVTFKR